MVEDTVKELILDLRKSWDSDSEMNLLYTLLRRHNLYNKRHIFRGMDITGGKELLLPYFSIGREFDAFTVSEMKEPVVQEAKKNVIAYATKEGEHRSGGIVVFEKNKVKGHILGGYTYNIAAPGAVKAIIQIVW
ncbi:hypothetical protein HOA92_03945 [archaeon]|jgi:hypothetical protein|nr:hypothetical protein [archaeon]MBT6762165.1 hypothetical protein [archaeon]